MRSRIYVGTVTHARLAPVEHAFRYPAFVFALDVDEIGALDATLRLFTSDRWGLFALHASDYLGERDGDLRSKLAGRIARSGAELALDRITLVTTPRVFGRGFNPVSFWYCYDADDLLSGVVAEVNNTFGEGHVYVLPARTARAAADESLRWRVAKAFHVSPFNDMRGDYDFRFTPLGERIDVRIHIRRDAERAFVARLEGAARPLTDGNLVRLAATYPLTAALTLPRILWQAYKLHYRRRLPVFPKPEPASPDTFAATRPAAISELAVTRRRTGAARVDEIGGTHGSH